MEGLVRESKFKPFRGTAYTLGRQTMALDPKHTNALFENLGQVPVGGAACHEDIDTVTSYLNQMQLKPVSDKKFFSMLGFSEVKAIDINNFEGAEIILDLNRDIPSTLLGTCDLLVDGSTLDNVFDPITALRNAVKLLKPNGRLCMIELANYSKHFTGIPYLIITPIWLYDYFCINQFLDCQMYATIYAPDGPLTFKFDHRFATRQRNNGLVAPIISEHPVALTVFAERGPVSSWDKTPTQHAYRPSSEWEAYEKTVSSFLESGRPTLMRNLTPYTQETVPQGWLYTLPETIKEGIVILEASYGSNCNPRHRGNVTEIVSSICNGKKEAKFKIDVNQLGDPAPGIEKDFCLTWQHAEDPKKRSHHLRLPAEAHGKFFQIPKQ